MNAEDRNTANFIVRAPTMTTPTLHCDENGNFLRISTQSRTHKKPKVLKDMDFLKSEDMFIFLDYELKENILEIISNDITFFKNLDIMDYSLLVGISHL
jgi:hypothetical protein